LAVFRGDERLIFAFHIGVESGRDEGWHEERLPQDGRSAAEVPAATILAAV